MDISALRRTAGTDVGDELANASSRMSSQVMGKEAFLKLLVTQLQNQDPLSPMDNKDLILQLSQFSTLEQTQNLNENFNSLLTTTNISAANSMIGKEVQYYDEENGYDIVTGKVSQISLANGAVTLTVDGKSVKMTQVLAVGEPAAETTEP